MQQKSSTNSTRNSEIAALIFRLLQHFWTADDRPETRQAQIEDWIDDLREFGPGIVAHACREWRRTKTRRPVPSEIRLLCIEAQREHRERIDGPVGSNINMEEYARSVGFPSAVARMDAISAGRERKAYLSSPENYERLRKLKEELLGARHRSGKPAHIATALGVKAREYTPEELRAGRIALGLEKPEAEK